MKTYKVAGLMTIALIFISGFTSDLGIETAAVSVNNYHNLSPIKQNILKGGTNGSLANLWGKDQSAKQDDPTKYVKYITPGEISRSIRIYEIPTKFSPEFIKDLRLRVNYKGPAKVKQTWSWYAYNLDTRRWTKIGDNVSATANTWTLMTFILKNPEQYVNGKNRIRIQMKSNNATGNAKLDYEGIRVTYPCFAQNNSYPTTCAEEDNVNIPLFGNRVSRFRVMVTHPRYDVGTDNCAADFSGCMLSTNKSSLVSDICNTLADDGITVVQGCNQPAWWRPYKMEVNAGTVSGEYDYLVLYRKIQDENQWPQFLVLYEDGNMRIKPQPPIGRDDTCFGSSVIIGPASGVNSTRPYVDVQSVEVDISKLTLDLTYRSGGSAHIKLAVDRLKATALVNVKYKTNINVPFSIFRSMYIEDGNADTDHIRTPLGGFSIQNGWSTFEGPWWFFFRKVRSKHNTSAPDFRITVIK